MTKPREMRHPTPPQKYRARGTGRTLLATIITGILGLIAGVLWHDDLRGLLNLSEPTATNHGDVAANATAELWTCSMHPQVMQEKQGLCPMCHMQLTPLKAGGDAGGAAESGHADMVVIDPGIVQNMGLRTTTVTEQPLRRAIRAVGYLTEAQPRVREVNLRVAGWIEHLHADTEGMLLKAGDPLFDLYSPQLQLVIQDLFVARRSRTSPQPGAGVTGNTTPDSAYDATVRRLEAMGVGEKQIEMIAEAERPPETVTFFSPINGTLTEKMVVPGGAVKVGDAVLRIVDLSVLWLDAQIHEQDVPFVRMGQKAIASIATVPGEAIEGEVIFLHPLVDATTRTTRVRLVIPNPKLTLRPGMYTTVTLSAELQERAVVVPREAVIDTGTRQVLFVTPGNNRFEPRSVKMGIAADDGMVQILEGLAAGEEVVTSGQFLLDTESRLREAIRKYMSEKSQAASGGDPARPGTPVDAGPPIDIAHLPKVDALLSAYLEVAELLGAVQQSKAPVEVTKLVAAAGDLQRAMSATPHGPLASKIATASEALQKQTIDRQRELFKPLSAAVVALAESSPPTGAADGVRRVAPKLYVVYCPMVQQRWLQKSETVANPFYATDMKLCGDVVKVINTSASNAP